MKNLFALFTLLVAVTAVPALGQSQYPDQDRDRDYVGQSNISSDDQREFNEQYEKWQRANATNNREDIDKHARKMEDIMARYRIPADTPFDAVATSGATGHRYDVREFQGRFNHDDQKKFDKAYEHWVEHRRRNDRDDVAKDEGEMLEVMSRYRIPRDVPYDALASSALGH